MYVLIYYLSNLVMEKKRKAICGKIVTAFESFLEGHTTA